MNNTTTDSFKVKLSLTDTSGASDNHIKESPTEKRKRRNERKKHVCAKCGAGFTRAYDLKMHLRKHSKPFKCSMCDATFIKRDSLGRHLERQHRHTELEVYVHCSLCQKKYRRKADLRKHLKVDHKVVLDYYKESGLKKCHRKRSKSLHNIESQQTMSIEPGIQAPSLNITSPQTERKGLDHNSKSILKYLMQTSPDKSELKKCLNGNALRTDVSSPSISHNLIQGNVCVKTVQINNGGPLLGQKLFQNPISSSGKKLTQIESSADLCDISGNYSLPKGITVTPFRVNKSPATDSMLPFEQGFSVSESKRYSLNFGVSPDPQLPENFMAESPENSLEGRISPIKPGYFRSRTPTKHNGPFESMDVSQSCDHSDQDIDVITIDSDSNISGKSFAQNGDSDCEIVTLSDESDTENNVNEVVALDKETSNENSLKRKKRKLIEPKILLPHHSGDKTGVSIVTYQAISPVKMSKTCISPKEKCHIGSKLLINTPEKCQTPGSNKVQKVKIQHSSNNQVISTNCNKVNREIRPLPKDDVKKILEKHGQTHVTNVNKPPEITLFPSSKNQNIKSSSNTALLKGVKVQTVCLTNPIKSKACKALNLSGKSSFKNSSTQGSSISVQEVTMDKSGPSLFGRINEKQNLSGFSDNQNNPNKKILIIKSNGDTSAGMRCHINSNAKEDNTQLSGIYPPQNKATCDRVGMSTSSMDQSSSLSEGDGKCGQKCEGIVNTNISDAQVNNSLSHGEMNQNQLNTFYHSQEMKQTLRSIVTQPFASELLRAKREKLTIDDIYEEKIAKLLDKIGLNTYQGIPICQYFSGSDSVPKRSHVDKQKILGSTANHIQRDCKGNSESKPLDPAQRARHQEQIRTRVASFLAMLERNKKEKKAPVVVKDHHNEVQKPSALPGNLANQNVPVKALIPEIGKQNSNVPAVGTVFDGVFKVPTKCAPSVHGTRPVKVVLKSNLTVPGRVINGLVNGTTEGVTLSSLALNHPVQEHVMQNGIQLVTNEVSSNGIVSSFIGGVPVSSVNLSQPVQNQVTNSHPIKISTEAVEHRAVMTPSTSMDRGIVQEENIKTKVRDIFVNQIKEDAVVSSTDFPEKHAFVPCSTKTSCSSLQRGIVANACSNSPLKFETVYKNNFLFVNHLSNTEKNNQQPVKIISPLKIVTKHDANVHTNKIDGLEISTAASISINSKGINVISPKSDSQQSLPEVDFLSGVSNGSFKHNLVSPTKLIFGTSCSNDDSISPIKDISPGKDGSLLTIQDINPAELQALMASPIKSFDMENSNLSTASQNELLETLQNFLKDVPKLASPQKPDSRSSLSPRASPGNESDASKAKPDSSFSIISSAKDLIENELTTSISSVNLNNLFTQSNIIKPEGHTPSKGKFFKNLSNNVQVSISQPCRRYSASPSPTEFVSQSTTSYEECHSDHTDMDTEFHDDNSLPEKLGSKCDGDDCDMEYVSKPLVVNAPELHDENTMDRIVSVVEDLKALGPS